MLILAPKITNRLRYIFELIINQLNGVEITFTTKLSDFLEFQGEKFSYGVFVDDKCLFFAANNLLFERNIIDKNLEYFDFEGNSAFFKTNDPKSALPFDMFAASFYLVSRFEEYLPHQRDTHDRFDYTESGAYKHNFILKPLVNIWALKLKNILLTRFPQITLKKQRFIFQPTVDIDSAFAYKNKGFTRTIGGMIKSLKNRDLLDLRKRISVIFGNTPDPFDTFNIQLSLIKQFGFNPIYFILLANYGTYDKSIPYNNRHLIHLIRLISDYAEIGIHPSYNSHNNPDLLQIEIERLSRIVKYDIVNSRQHFLRLQLPNTYNNLIDNGIEHDYTMGYSQTPGFRASICSPFKFYDLSRDVMTNLMVHPFSIMDGALRKTMKQSESEAFELLSSLMEEVYQVGGTFIPVWHNHALFNNENDGNWLDLYVKMLEKATVLTNQ